MSRTTMSRATVSRAGLILATLACACTRSDNTEPSARQPAPLAEARRGAPDLSKGPSMTNTADANTIGGPLDLAAVVAGTTVEFTLTNTGDAPIVVNLAVVAGGERHLDWFEVVVDVGGQQRTLRFTDDRNRSAIQRETLAPGGTVTEKVDLAAWAVRPRNGGAPLPSGSGTLRVTYEVSGDPQAWNGRLGAGPIAVAFP